MTEVVLNDRLGKKVPVKCNDDDTIGDLKELVVAAAPATSSSSSGVLWEFKKIMRNIYPTYSKSPDFTTKRRRASAAATRRAAAAALEECCIAVEEGLDSIYRRSRSGWWRLETSRSCWMCLSRRAAPTRSESRNGTKSTTAWASSELYYNYLLLLRIGKIGFLRIGKV